MTTDHIPDDRKKVPAVAGPVQHGVRALVERLRLRTLVQHGGPRGMDYGWNLQEHDSELHRDAASCLLELLRWKSTHAPRLEALEGLLRTAQQDAHRAREAITTLESERAANAVMTDELERLRAAADAVLREAQFYGGCYGVTQHGKAAMELLSRLLRPTFELTGYPGQHRQRKAPRRDLPGYSG